METKFILDILSGIVVPIIVAFIPLVWRWLSGRPFAVPKLFYLGLAVVAITGLGVTRYGWVNDFYKPAPPPDPLATLTKGDESWFRNYVTKMESPAAKYGNFVFRQINRVVFVLGRDLYDIELISGEVKEVDLGKTSYEFPVVGQTESDTDDRLVRYFDAKSGRRLEERKAKAESIPDLKRGAFFYAVIEVPKEFQIVKLGRTKRTMRCLGTVDSLGLSLQRYTGGYNSFENIVIFDTRLEEKSKGLYSVEVNEQKVQLKRHELEPIKIDGASIDSIVRERVNLLGNQFGDVGALFAELPNKTWREAYRFVISGVKRQLTFQFVRKDE